ncbi:urease subunit beta [Kineococcus rubinsiae]|uniref:urease subunit beta n=1 Tax=Kineococcus rubinsiae TaxID=2609562 RepID=UPI0014306CD3|nr:urease subunit beta [Kineococcus rubinsiae]NIZ92342.1 urease subunit beta [Kineococcus rubinsiae]
MNLLPTELERLTVFLAAEFARRNLREGIPLSHPEAVAYLTDEVMLAARRGADYPDVRDGAGRLLRADQVEPGVAEMVRVVMVDAPFAEGTKLVAVFDPIPGTEGALVPGEVFVGAEPVELFGGVERVRVSVLNTGDRDVQVRSQTHFFEVNPALDFDRRAAWGRTLDVPAGGGVRFEPGIPVEVALVPVAGDRVVFGFAGLVDGPLDAPGALEDAERRAAEQGFLGVRGGPGAPVGAGRQGDA